METPILINTEQLTQILQWLQVIAEGVGFAGGILAALIISTTWKG